MSQWFRMYAAMRNDPKVQRLPADVFKAWVNMLCLAAEHDGALPSISDIAFDLRLAEAKAKRIIETLRDAGLLDVSDEGMEPHNWRSRQYKSDVSTTRVKRFRERSRQQDETVSVTPPDTETEQNREEPPSGVAPPTNGASNDGTRGSRIAADWQPDTEDRNFAAGLGLDPDRTAERFRDYWQAKPGKDGRKTDWKATWRNWCRRDLEFAPGHAGGGKAGGNGSRAGGVMDAAARVIARRHGQTGL